MYRRFAIYFTPERALAETGSAWLGWDISQGCRVPHPRIDGLNLAALTKRPRKYGMHATIKPPMTLADGSRPEEFIEAASEIVKGLPLVALTGLRVSQIGRFLALTVEGDQTALNAMAAQVVAQLDPFRAAPTSEETNRRRQGHLTPSQGRNLARWGYPHVMEDFNFHITLTSPVKNANEVLPTAAAYFAPVLPTPFVIGALTVAGEDVDGMFHAFARLPLGG